MKAAASTALNIPMNETDALGWVALAPPPSEDWSSLASSWLERAETVEAAYQAWEALRSQYANAVQQDAQKRAYLQLHGEFVLGAAQQTHVEGLPSEVAEGEWIEQSRQRLSSVFQMWEDAQSQMKHCFEQASREIEQEILRRTDRTLTAVRPKLHLSIHYVGKAHCVLQFERIDELTSVLLSRLISGKVPTHYAFLFDDSVSQLNGAADVTYADAPSPSHTPSSPWPFIQKLLDDKARLSAPWKGQIPMACEGGILWILKQKGVVMEVEQVAIEGVQASEVLELAKAQKIVAHFLRWMREGKIEFQLQPHALQPP